MPLAAFFPIIYLSSLDCLSLGTDSCVNAYHPSSSSSSCCFLFVFFFYIFSPVTFLLDFCCCYCRRMDGYRLNEHFHMKNHEAKTTTNIEMTNGLLSEDDDCPCCIAAGCSPVDNNNTKIKNQKYELGIFIFKNCLTCFGSEKNGFSLIILYNNGRYRGHTLDYIRQFDSR